MYWIHPLDVWNRYKRTLNIDESTNIYINKNTVIKRFGRWLYARISSVKGLWTTCFARIQGKLENRKLPSPCQPVLFYIWASTARAVSYFRVFPVPCAGVRIGGVECFIFTHAIGGVECFILTYAIILGGHIHTQVVCVRLRMGGVGWDVKNVLKLTLASRIEMFSPIFKKYQKWYITLPNSVIVPESRSIVFGSPARENSVFWIHWIRIH